MNKYFISSYGVCAASVVAVVVASSVELSNSGTTLELLASAIARLQQCVPILRYQDLVRFRSWLEELGLVLR